MEAEEWQLEWEAPSGSGPSAQRLDAAFVLPRLHINPRTLPGGACAPLPAAPPPLPVPLTVGVAADELRASLLLDCNPAGLGSAPAAGLEAALLQLQGLQVLPANGFDCFAMPPRKPLCKQLMF